MILSFELTMPNRGSWNGEWSGDRYFYAKTVNLGRGKAAARKGRTILDRGYFHYSWPDGWGAGISVKEVSSREAAKIRKGSNGFCGYEWMMRSILAHNEIRADAT